MAPSERGRREREHKLEAAHKHVTFCELRLHRTSDSCHFDVDLKRREPLHRCVRVIPHNYSEVVASIGRKIHKRRRRNCVVEINTLTSR